jgi:hypothetical protein
VWDKEHWKATAEVEGDKNCLYREEDEVRNSKCELRKLYSSENN